MKREGNFSNPGRESDKVDKQEAVEKTESIILAHIDQPDLENLPDEQLERKQEQYEAVISIFQEAIDDPRSGLGPVNACSKIFSIFNSVYHGYREKDIDKNIWPNTLRLVQHFEQEPETYAALFLFFRFPEETNQINEKVLYPINKERPREIIKVLSAAQESMQQELARVLEKLQQAK